MILRRFPLVSGLVIGILVALFALGNLDVWLRAADAQVPFGAFRIMDGTHTQLARVNHTGQLAVDATVTVTSDSVNVFHQSTIAHVSSVTHVSGRIILQNVAGTAVTMTGTRLDVECSGCAAASVVAVSHISAALHIGGTINGAQLHVQGLGLPGASHGGILTVQGITGMNPVVGRLVGAPNVGLGALVTHTGQLGVTCFTNAGVAESCGGGGATDAVNVFHQSTVRHISSVTHVVILDWQRWAHLQVSQSGTWIVAAAHIQNMPSVAQGGTWTVQATHQGGEWNVRHITSVTHVALMSVAGTPLGLGSGLPIGHITSVVHISAASTPWNFNMALAIRCVNTGATAFESCGGTVTSDTVNVFHQSTIAHVSSVTHIALMNVAGTPLGLGAGLPIGHVTSVLHIAVSGLGTPTQALSVRCVNTGATAFADCGGGGGSGDAVNVFHQSTIAHVSSVTHVMIASHQVIRIMGAHVTGSIHVAGLTNVGSGAPGTGTTQMVCHSTLAIHVAAAAPGYTQIIHLTSSNGGINQAQWRIYICSIMVVSAHAQGFSLLEGLGTTCQGQPRHAVIGSWRPDDSVVLAANGGFSIASPFPTLSTQVPGNNLCIGQTTRTSGGSISGTMSYRAGP